MPITIQGVAYHAIAEITKELRISRQTLWRWRQEGKIPQGSRFRDRQIVFSPAEREAIREYAHHLEPVELVAEQISLFGTPPRKEK